MTSRIGEHYEVVRELRRGAWVTVIEARHTILGRRTLIKWLNPAFKNDEELVGRLRREARLGASVDHPNVARIYEVGDAEDRPYVAIEWIEGDDLSDVLDQEGSFTPDKALRLARDLLAGLSAIHGVGIVHRDLSPMNVRITPDGVARITDFGLATGPFDTHYTLPGSVVGTPGYLSPEQATGKQADERSDLFSCGILIHEALSGKPLFKHDDLIETLKKVRNQPVPLLEGEVEGVPEGFDGWLLQLLEKKPDDRFSSAREALDALLELTGAPSESSKVVRKRVRRATSWGAVVVVVIVVLAGVLSLPTYFGRQETTDSIKQEADSLASSMQDSSQAIPADTELSEERGAEPTETPPPTPSRREQEERPLRTESTPNGVKTGHSEDSLATRDNTQASPEPEIPAATPESAKGWLQLRTHPWAAVYIDAQRIGATPGLKPIELVEGDVQVVLDNPGFPPIPVEVTIVPAETTNVLVELDQHVAILSVTATPWAKVYIDDTPLGDTPIGRAIYLSPGVHMIRFAHPEFGDVFREVIAEKGKEITLHIDMQSEGTGFAPSREEGSK